MKLTIRKDEKYVVGKNIFFSWTQYLDESDVPILHPIDKRYRNHAIYVKVVRIKRLSDQFIEIEFEPVSKNINGNANRFIFIVYDDSVIELPDQHYNYVGVSKLLKELAPATPMIDDYVSRIDNHYSSYNEKIRKLKSEIDTLNHLIEECRQTESEIRDVIDMEFTEVLDDVVNKKQEEDAYNKEIMKYIKDM